MSFSSLLPASDFSWDWSRSSKRNGGYNQKAVYLYLKPTSIVYGETIQLSDVCSCKGETRVCDELYSMHLIQSPQPNEVKKIDATFVKELLLLEWPKVHWYLEGAKQSFVKAYADFLTEDHIFRQVKSEVESMSPLDLNMKFKLDGVRISKRIPVRDLNSPISINRVDSIRAEIIKLASRRSLVQIKLPLLIGMESDDYNHKHIVSASISVQRRFLYFRSAGTRGEDASTLKVDAKWSTQTGHYKRYVFDRSFLTGKTLKKEVAVKQVLQKSLFTLPLLVRRGQSVRFKSKLGSLLVEGKAKAESSGKKGQIVTIKSGSFKRKITARVVSKGLVVLE